MVGTNGTISLCYVVPEVQHRGVGKRMLAALEVQAMQSNLTSLRVESTLTAKPFYERNGYACIRDSIAAAGQHGGYALQKVLSL